MIKNKIKTYIGLSCLSLSLFASCAKETEPFEGKTDNISTNNDKAQEDNAAGESISISLSGDMLEDEFRAMGFSLADRGGSYTNEFKPVLRGSNSVVSVYLVLLKENDSKSLFVQRVLFNRSKNGENTIDPHKIFYRGEVKLPQGYSLADTGEWYVMGLANFDYTYTDNSKTQSSHARFGNSDSQPENVVGSDSRINLASSIFGSGSLNSRISIESAPFVSQWKKIKKLESAVEGSSSKLYTAEVEGLRFKPQGVLIQYDLGDNINGAKDIRRHAIVSNALAFSGKYDLSAASLYQKFLYRDQSTGIGMPEWQEDPANMSGYRLYRYKEADPLAIGEQVYPWNVPAASDALTETMGLNPSLIEEIALDGDAHGVIRAPWYEEGSKQWRFAPSQVGTRRVTYFWGMPRKTTPNKPCTYFLASAYDRLTSTDNYINQDIEPNSLEITIAHYNIYHFAKQNVTDIDTKIQDYETQIQKYEQAPSGETPDTQAKRLRKLKETKILLSSAKANKILLEEYLADALKNIGGTYNKAIEDKAKEDIKAYYERLRKEAVQQVTPRTQPLVVLYQTNTNFTNDKNGKVVHAQTVLTSDLMFSELIYKQMDDGKAYTIAEIHNPTADYIDLRQYAIARLIPNGDHLSYRRADGTATDNLNEALIMPLSVVDPEETDPFTQNRYMTTWAGDKGKYDRLEKNIQGAYTNAELYPKHDRWNALHYYPNDPDLFEGMIRSNYPQKQDFYAYRVKDGDLLPLGQSQTILLGGGKFLERVNLQKYTSGIDWDKLPDGLKYPTPRLARWAFAYNDGVRQSDGSLGEGTLDFKPGEGLVLLKKHAHGGWQVVDTTAPIGPHGLGYSGTYATFQALFRGKTEFSFRRVDHVYFPCIFPFRTKSSSKTSGEADDWVTNDLSLGSNTMGYRNSDKSNRSYNRTLNWSWKRTPLDFTYTAYRTNIPK